MHEKELSYRFLGVLSWKYKCWNFQTQVPHLSHLRQHGQKWPLILAYHNFWMLRSRPVTGTSVPESMDSSKPLLDSENQSHVFIPAAIHENTRHLKLLSHLSSRDLTSFPTSSPSSYLLLFKKKCWKLRNTKCGCFLYLIDYFSL